MEIGDRVKIFLHRESELKGKTGEIVGPGMANTGMSSPVEANIFITRRPDLVSWIVILDDSDQEVECFELELDLLT